MVKMRNVNQDFWKNKKVFITGNTGFKGSWMSIWLTSMGAEIKGYSKLPETHPSLFNEAGLGSKYETIFADIRDYDCLKDAIDSFMPDIVFHLAAQPLVRYSYEHPLETFETNVIGTANVLNACRGISSIKSIVIITTDKCYENKEWPWAYRENDPMGGYDPYSSSKGCAELVTDSFRRSFFTDTNTGIASARAGNVIGGGDWSLDRLFPDIIKAFNNDEKVIIRNPNSIRPWQHVLEPISGYLILAEQLFVDKNKFSQAFNFGPREEDCRTVQSVLDIITTYWDECPGYVLDETLQPHEARTLKLDISKARYELNWSPKWSLEETINRIIAWNFSWRNKENLYDICIKEINDFNEND